MSSSDNQPIERSSDPPSGPRHADSSAFVLADLDYELPPELIAQSPATERDQARLLIVQEDQAPLIDARITELPDFLRPGDLLVLNDTRVVPARIRLRRATGGRMEGLFVAEHARGLWEVMLKGAARCRRGEALILLDRSGNPARTVTLVDRTSDGHWIVALTRLQSEDARDSARQAVGTEEDAVVVLNRIGMAPLPPYIRRDIGTPSKPADAAVPISSDASHAAPVADDLDRYQTVYARTPGAVAAPTAGLHFTPQLLDRLVDGGVTRAFVTLHVGLGTFKPITAERISDHVMHEERFDLPEATVEAIQRCRRCGGRVIAVGTTTVRVLESCVDSSGELHAARGATRLFIYPPYRFRTADLLLTNFHLPGSTLLALVMAFGGIVRTKDAYAHAIRSWFRFYSYGDAMLITRCADTETPRLET